MWYLTHINDSGARGCDDRAGLAGAGAQRRVARIRADGASWSLK